MKDVVLISFACALFCAASCQHDRTRPVGDGAVITGEITSFSVLTRQKDETRFALRITNAAVVRGVFDLTSFAMPLAYGVQHSFVVEWSDPFQIAGQKGIRVEGRKCSILMQSNRVMKVTGDWEKD